MGCNGVGCGVRMKCWARMQAKRQKHRCSLCYSFQPHVHWERFDEPLHRKKPAFIGVCFMGDFYDPRISDRVRYSLLLRMREASWHSFLILTKQPQNIDFDEPFPKNVCIGVSVNRKQDLDRIDRLRETSARWKAVSFEPLYEDIPVDLKGINWVIIGAQTRPVVQPEPEWVDNLMMEAKHHEIPVFLKNNLTFESACKNHVLSVQGEIV